MLDAVRIAGRWVSKHILARLSARSISDNPPTRRSVVQGFCRSTHWYDRKGKACLASANVALNRLEKLGLVRLPAPAPRCPRKQPRQLVDDGKPLPEIPRRADCLKEITLQLIQGQEDPDHLLWNRLIIREHPLAAAPLVGAQLRYLIRSPEGIIGAFGIGPASYHLECRDRWIGWDEPTRQASLTRIIGLSRFLIRPGVCSRNLASRCYGLLLKRVSRDWNERYAIQPVLIETFVDRSTQTGTSLSAANWRRLGQSRGRGRSSLSVRVRPKSAKDVWVYELQSSARQHLLRTPIVSIAPRSIFHGLSTASWAQEELDGLKLGDTRLENRFALMLDCRWKNPNHSFYRSFGSAAGGKAAYRLIESPQAAVSFSSLLAPHQQQTHRRMAAESLVLLAQDTTALSYNTLGKTTGLGPVGDHRNPGRGLWLHSLQAFRTDGIPLGCAWAKLWAREACQSDTDRRNEQSVCEKESGRWIEAYQSALRMAHSMPQTHLIVCGDRESDIFELFDQCQSAPSHLHLLVRAQHNRGLTEGGKLWNKLVEQPAQGTLSVRVSRRENCPARQATLEVRWAPIEAATPRVALKKSWQPISLYAVLAREIAPPAGQEPIEWMLLTDWKVDTLKMALRMIQWYGLRWGIECWHQVLKDVCKVEKRQMESAQALERALVLDMIVAWRALMLCRLGRKHPTLPAGLFYCAPELAVLEVYKKKLPQHAQSKAVGPVAEPAPLGDPEGKSKQNASGNGTKPSVERSDNSSTLSLFQANMVIAMLAGFWGRKADGHPGPKVLAEGLKILAALVNHQKLTRQVLKKPPIRSKRSREPG